MSHDEFIRKTDEKSLYTQIKTLVARAQNIAANELQKRRDELQKLLEYEDKIYEDEFTKKVKSRIDEDIMKRKDVLLKIKEENDQEEKQFLKRKRIQQYMNSCYEIREALRQKETDIVKECQMEQILEHERAERDRRDLDKYWVDVLRLNDEIADERQRNERCLKRDLNQQMKYVLDLQIEDKQRQLDEKRRENEAEAERIKKVMETIRLEEFDRKYKDRSPRKAKYRDELLKMIEENKKKRQTEADEAAESHRQMVREIKRLEALQLEAIQAKKREFYKATMEYIDYSRRMRKLEEGRDKMFNDRIDDLCHVDICTKQNMKYQRELKAEKAQKCFADLRKQVCEQYERRLQEEAQRKECKILENLFGRDEITREEIMARRRKNRKELDDHMEALKRYRQEEEAKLKADFGRASNDPLFCAQLADMYIPEGIDYLEPHANWRILMCPQKKYAAKPAQPIADKVSSTLLGNPLEPNKAVECSTENSTCIVPCGCAARWAKPGCCYLDLPKQITDEEAENLNNKLNDKLSAEKII